MIERNRLKRRIAELAAVFSAVAFGGVFIATAQVANWHGSESAPRSVLHEVAELPAQADRLVTWLPDQWTRDRAMEPATRVRIEAAYVRAWAAIGRYQTTGDTTPVATTFAEPARAAVLAMPRGATASWSIAHHLRLTFYALDGATVAVHDTDANVVRSTVAAGVPVLAEQHERYQAVLVLQDGYWRVQQLRRTGADPPVVVSRSTDAVAAGTQTDGGTGTDGGAGTDAEAGTDAGTGATVVSGVDRRTPRTIPASRGVGYVLPVGSPLDERDIAADLAATTKLGLDTVRLPLSYAELGGATPAAEKLRRIRRFLDLAEAREIRVVPVLFTGLAQVTPDVWAATDAHLRTVVNGLRHPAIVMWDLADAPDQLAAGQGGSVEVCAWLVHTVTQLRTLDPLVPATVSWSSAAAAGSRTVNALFDVVSLAWDGSREELAPALAAISRTAAGRPVMLSRYGISTYNSVFPGGHTEAEQAYDLAQARLIADRTGVRGIVFAALRDGMTSRADSRLPWRSGAHAAEGLLRADGTPKASASLVGPRANLTTVAPAPSSEALRKPFWWLVTTLACAALLLVLFHTRRTAQRPARPRVARPRVARPRVDRPET